MVDLYVHRRGPARFLSAASTVTADPFLRLVPRERRMGRDRSLSFETPASFDERFSDVWEATWRRHAITGERGADVLNWKYELDTGHPSDYSIFAAVDAGGRVAGYVVYKVKDDVRHIFDIACFDSKPVIDALLAAFLADARRERAIGVTFLCLGSLGLLGKRLRSFGFLSRSEDKRLRVYVQDPAPASIFSNGTTGTSSWETTTSRVAGPADVGHGAEAWLCMLPAAARRFRVADARLAAALRGGGAELVCVSPDVEIVSRIEELRGGAPVAVVSLGHPGWTRGSLPARIAKRSAASARVRAEAVLAGRALRRRGYPLTEIVTWDVGHAFREAGSRPPRSAVEYMPQCALVFGRRAAAGQSLADSALEDAGGCRPR